MDDITFTNSLTWTFESSRLPEGLSVSTNLIPKSNAGCFDRQFCAHNVSIKEGFLHLTVPGGQRGEPIGCAEISTDFKFLYGSVSTYAILAAEAGVCNGKFGPSKPLELSQLTCPGMFMYESDSQETDIEWLSDNSSAGNRRFSESGNIVHHVNQPTGELSHGETHGIAQVPADATSHVHEYRLDWTPTWTSISIDGVKRITHRTNIPRQPGRFMWNCWSNGNPSWSGGPPSGDATLRIRKIVLRYNIEQDS